jgi:hypothetical protein
MEHTLAEALPKKAIDQPGLHHPRAGMLAWSGVGAGRWLPPLLLALATIVALAAAYSARPFVTIDMGDYYDMPYLPNMRDRDSASADFYAREVGAIGPDQTIDWPASQTTLEIPGKRQGLWQVTVLGADRSDGIALKGYTLSANDIRLWLARGGSNEMVLVIPPAIAAADTIRLRLEPGLVGDPDAPPGVAKQIKLAPANTYRWTSGNSTIGLPGLGRGDWMITLKAAVQHPDRSPLDATISANGTPIARLADSGPRQISLFVPAELVPDGNLTLGISANTFKDPRELGVLLYEVSVAPAGPRAIVPPLLYLGYALVVALCVYFCLLRLIRRPLVAALAALALVLGGAWALAVARYPTAFMLPRLAGLAIWRVGLLLALERLLPWAFAKAGAPLSDWLLRALLLIFFVGYWIKAGGMLYPYFVGIDMSLQMQWARRIFSGEFGLFYGTNNPMNERTMPTAEWGANRPVIPYSPWFHIFAGSFMLVPLPMVLVGHMFSALVDTSRVFLIALLARKSGLSEREGLFASLLYAITPATFLLHSWGNLPTTFGIWWTLVTTVFIVTTYRRLGQRGPFVALTLLLTVTMLIYTVMAVFMVVFLVLLLPALWFIESTKRHEEPQNDTKQALREPSRAFADPSPGSRRPVVAIALALLAACVLSALIYYGQYIPLIVQRTLPYFFGGVPGQQAGIQNHQPFLEYLAEYIPRLGYTARPVIYGLWIPLILAAVGLLRLRRRRVLALMLAWAVVTALFMIAGSRISMVDKQVFYFMPAMMLLAAPVLNWLWERGIIGRLAVGGAYLFTFAVALNLWIERIVTVRQ